MLDLDDIQGDVPIGLQKDFEEFVFFKILEKDAFKLALRRDVIGRITSARQAQQRELAIARRHRLGEVRRDPMPGLNLGFTKDGDKPSGVWATGNLLIGYTGANGG